MLVSCFRFWVFYRAKQDGPVVLVSFRFPFFLFLLLSKCYVMYNFSLFCFPLIGLFVLRVGDTLGKVMKIMPMTMGMATR